MLLLHVCLLFVVALLFGEGERGAVRGILSLDAHGPRFGLKGRGGGKCESYGDARWLVMLLLVGMTSHECLSNY